MTSRVDETMGDDPGWDVQIAKFEDLYGVENEADLGGTAGIRWLESGGSKAMIKSQSVEAF